LGNGANVTLCCTGSEEEDVLDDWPSIIPAGDDVSEELIEDEANELVGISTDSAGVFLSGESGDICRLDVIFSCNCDISNVEL
jgi:hypothetical protein